MLVVDDNPDIRDFIAELLEGAGYEVDSASNGDEALGLMEERPAKVVVTDLFMPERDGLETIQTLRRQFPGTGVVAISGGRVTPGGTSEYLSVARIAGADFTLRKPFTAEDLYQAVRQACERAHSP